MPKRSRKLTSAKEKPKRLSDYLPRRDANQAAFDVIQKIIKGTGGTIEKNPFAVALGRLGGLKGGIARAAKLSPSQRRASARKAANARWHK